MSDMVQRLRDSADYLERLLAQARERGEDTSEDDWRIADLRDAADRAEEDNWRQPWIHGEESHE